MQVVQQANKSSQLLKCARKKTRAIIWVSRVGIRKDLFKMWLLNYHPGEEQASTRTGGNKPSVCLARRKTQKAGTW